MGLYDVNSKQDVLSVKTCVFIGSVYERYLKQTLDKKTAIMLLESIWSVVAGCIDQETVTIYDEAYKEISK